MLTSPNAYFNAIMQDDGNFVIYYNKATVGYTPIWATNTKTFSTLPHRFTLQTDAKLVVYSANNGVRWTANTVVKNPTYLAMQNDGNLVLYDIATNAALWASNSNRCSGSSQCNSMGLCPITNVC